MEPWRMSVAIKNAVDDFHCKHDKEKTVHELLNIWKQCSSDLPSNDVTVRNIACELCNLLVKTKSFEALSAFLEALPKTPEFTSYESVIRAKIYCALHQGETGTVYELIKVSVISFDAFFLRSRDHPPK